jgi:D-sedoheptulose 7-phosphate isomerase
MVAAPRTRSTFAAEFSRFAVERRLLPALALTTDTSVLTAISNDYGSEQVLCARQVRGLGRPGDTAGVPTSAFAERAVGRWLRHARPAWRQLIDRAMGTAMRGRCDSALWCLLTKRRSSSRFTWWRGI